MTRRLEFMVTGGIPPGTTFGDINETYHTASLVTVLEQACFTEPRCFEDILRHVEAPTAVTVVARARGGVDTTPLVGCAQAVQLQGQSHVWLVGPVCVRPAWRANGIGESLLRELTREVYIRHPAARVLLADCVPGGDGDKFFGALADRELLEVERLTPHTTLSDVALYTWPARAVGNFYEI